MTRLIVYSTAFVAFLGGKLNVTDSSRDSSLTPPSDRDDLGCNIHSRLDHLDGRHSRRRTLHQDDWTSQELFFHNGTLYTLPTTGGLFGLRQVLLFDVEVCGVYDVAYGGAGTGYTSGVHSGYTWWEAEEGSRVEGTRQLVIIDRGGAMC
jgi:hypothetical protein